jgi:hypothetical protein
MQHTDEHPEPEIIVRRAGSYVLWIYVNSNDARVMIEQHAPRFGNLYPPRTDHYDLFVSEDNEARIDEIMQYLQSLA